MTSSRRNRRKTISSGHRRSTWRLQGHSGLQRGRNTASQEGAASNVDTSNPDNVKQDTVHARLRISGSTMTSSRRNRRKTISSGHRRSTGRLQGHAGLQRGRNTASQEGAASNVDTSNPDNVKQYTVHDCTCPAFALSSTHGHAFKDRQRFSDKSLRLDQIGADMPAMTSSM